MNAVLLFPVLLFAAPPVTGAVPENNDDAYKLDDAYCKALTGGGDQSARQYLLGGMSWMAETVTYDNYKNVSRDPVRHDEGDISDVLKAIAQIDKTGRKSLNAMLGGSGKEGADGETIGEVTADKADKMMQPAKALMDKFKQSHAAFWYIARMNKPGYWHPKNPIRPLLDSVPKKGQYTLDVHRFSIESIQGPLKTKKIWTLKILRLKVAPNFDTQWKILPAADWNPEE